MAVNKSQQRASLGKTSSVPKRRHKPANKQWFWMGLSLSGIAMLSAAAGAMLAISLSSRPFEQQPLSAAEAAIFDEEAISTTDIRLPRLTRPVNILVLGTKVLTTDIGQSSKELGYHALVNSFEGHADTLLLLRFDPYTKELTLLSIPRDTRVEFEDYGTGKINAANQLGGAPLTAKTVTHLLEETPIDRYVRVNVQGVEKLIDALGGVEIYVPKDMKYRDDSQHLYIDLKAGQQHLDGEQAVQFMRFRHDAYGDIGRVQRQQLLMRAVVEQALDVKTIQRVPKILGVIKDHIDTNLTVEEILALSGFAARVDRDRVSMLLLPGEFGHRDSKTASYWVPDPQGIATIAARYFDRGYADEEVTRSDRETIKIAIQDSTDNPEAVRALHRLLHEAGYQRIYISQDWPQPLDTTRIVAQSGDDELAAMVQHVLGIGEVRVESTGVLTTDVTIQLGQDWGEAFPVHRSELRSDS